MSEQEVLDPKEVEQQLLNEQSQPQVSDDPEEMAATLFTLYRPRYDALVNNLSSNAMRRLLKKMVVFPLNEKEMKSTSKEENEAFAISQRLLEAKYVMIMSTYQKAAEEAYKKQQETEQVKTQEETQKENENG